MKITKILKFPSFYCNLINLIFRINSFLSLKAIAINYFRTRGNRSLVIELRTILNKAQNSYITIKFEVESFSIFTI